LYVQAEIRLQWALARSKFEEYFTAFTEVKTAYKQLEKNQKLYPGFIANKKSLGILHALVGTIPDGYKWGVKLLGGMDGTIEQGQREIKEVIDYASRHEFIFEEETQVMYAFLMLHLKNQDETAWDIINAGNLKSNNSPLTCFALANIAMRTGKNDEAISILQNRPTGSQFMPFHYLDFMLGLAKLYRQDADANFYIGRFVSNFKGRNYIKEAYQKLAWYNLLNNNESAYYLNMALCQSRGEKTIEADKNALKEAKFGELPDKTLLQARLLFDGGYYKRAYSLLKSKTENSFQKKHFQLEYHYRLGRITDKLKKLDEAIFYYQKTIDDGQYESFFFACNAALQIGHIYEKLNQFEKAKSYYNLCLSLKPDEYRNGLHQKAKAGLNRLKF
jgi:tetratricopeptide (TPR) repeat protein